MNTMLKIVVVASSLVVMLFADVRVPPVQMVPDAEAIFGVRRRAFRRGVFIGASMGAASAGSADMYHQQSATSQQQAATAQQQSATAAQQSATAQQQATTAQQLVTRPAIPAPPPAAGGKPLPLGTVVSALPAGCTSTPVGGVAYYYCSGNFYRAVFQGTTLVYVTAKPG